MNEYGYAVDGNHYHVSQVEIDETGRWHPRKGAVPGPIARLSEFGEPLPLDEPAAGYLAAWRNKAGTYATKIDAPETQHVTVDLVLDGETLDAVVEASTSVDPLPFEEDDAPATGEDRAIRRKNRP